MSDSKLLFMAQPPASVLAQMRGAVARRGLDRHLGRTMFAPSNWHQSLSMRLPADARDVLRHVGSRVHVPAFTLTFRRLLRRGKLWLLPADSSAPFDRLIAAIRADLPPCHSGMPNNHPHVTVCYCADTGDNRPAEDAGPLFWRIDELCLVEGGGSPYHYEVIDRWPLLPAPPGAEMQQPLF